MNTTNQTLFTSLTLGPLQLSNRIVVAPMTRMASKNHIPGEQNTSYYRRFIQGGAALIITECTFINHPSANGYPNSPAFYGEALEGWSKVVEAVHASGGKIIPQIWHAGGKRAPGTQPNPEHIAQGPSDVFIDGTQQVQAMTQKDINGVIAAFAQAAADAQEIGFDGVEIHGAHSFLIDEFLWTETNHRDDCYGGSLENRTRFAVEIVKAIRERVGPDYPICFRFSQWKQEDYNARIADSPAELREILTLLVNAGVDIFHPSTRRFWEPAFADSPLSLAAWSKQLTGKPVIAVGNVGLEEPFDLSIFANDKFTTHPASIDRVEEALARNEFDLIAVGRALLGDSDWPNKMRTNQLKEIIPFNQQSLTQLQIN